MTNLVTFAKKLWKDATSGGTPITAAELNRMEDGINNCATQINKLGDSVSQKVLTYTFATDANSLKNGVYHIGNSENMPFSYGTLIQFGSDSFEDGYITQLAMDINTKKVYARGHLSGRWSEWREL